ncbi:serine/threonine-protein kinase KIN2 [Chytridiales sp. JEL 0842]|nr:serine/threonine-protein kinase KIN2 [Chytridiales sp. JEL 0842]
MVSPNTGAVVAPSANVTDLQQQTAVTTNQPDLDVPASVIKRKQPMMVQGPIERLNAVIKEQHYTTTHSASSLEQHALRSQNSNSTIVDSFNNQYAEDGLAGDVDSHQLTPIDGSSPTQRRRHYTNEADSGDNNSSKQLYQPIEPLLLRASKSNQHLKSLVTTGAPSLTSSHSMPASPASRRHASSAKDLTKPKPFEIPITPFTSPIRPLLKEPSSQPSPGTSLPGTPNTRRRKHPGYFLDQNQPAPSSLNQAPLPPLPSKDSTQVEIGDFDTPPTPPPKPTTSSTSHSIANSTSTGQTDYKPPSTRLRNIPAPLKRALRGIPSKSEGRLVFNGVWRVGRTIGMGSSGIVKLVKHVATGKVCVVKCVKRPVDKPSLKPSERNKDGISYREHFMIREALMGIILDHPNIVKLHSFIVGKRHFYFFYEYVPGIDLADMISRDGRMDEARARGMFAQILSAINYSHKSHVIHRDIKLENIRVDAQTDAVKVLDFGFATFHSDKFSQHSSCGSPSYAAPEIFNHQPYKGPEVDVWSLGICLYGMVVGGLPFDDSSFQTLSNSIKAGVVVYPNYLSNELKYLISRMLTVSSSQRATMREILASPWLQGLVPSIESAQPFVPAISLTWVENTLRMPKHQRGEAVMLEIVRRQVYRQRAMEMDWSESKRREESARNFTLGRMGSRGSMGSLERNIGPATATTRAHTMTPSWLKKFATPLEGNSGSNGAGQHEGGKYFTPPPTAGSPRKGPSLISRAFTTRKNYGGSLHNSSSSNSTQGSRRSRVTSTGFDNGPVFISPEDRKFPARNTSNNAGHIFHLRSTTAPSTPLSNTPSMFTYNSPNTTNTPPQEVLYSQRAGNAAAHIRASTTAATQDLQNTMSDELDSSLMFYTPRESNGSTFSQAAQWLTQVFKPKPRGGLKRFKWFTGKVQVSKNSRREFGYKSAKSGKSEASRRSGRSEGGEGSEDSDGNEEVSDEEEDEEDNDDQSFCATLDKT